MPTSSTSRIARFICWQPNSRYEFLLPSSEFLLTHGSGMLRKGAGGSQGGGAGAPATQDQAQAPGRPGDANGKCQEDHHPRQGYQGKHDGLPSAAHRTVERFQPLRDWSRQTSNRTTIGPGPPRSPTHPARKGQKRVNFWTIPQPVVCVGQARCPHSAQPEHTAQNERHGSAWNAEWSASSPQHASAERVTSERAFADGTRTATAPVRQTVPLARSRYVLDR